MPDKPSAEVLQWWANADTLKLFYCNRRGLVRVGTSEFAYETDEREFFLHAVHVFAPSVIESLKADVLPTFGPCVEGRKVLSILWRDLSRDRCPALRSALEVWAGNWGFEEHRWNREPTWVLDAALRLVSRWHDGHTENELTLARDIYYPPSRSAEDDNELRTLRGFVLLVFSHVLQQRPWLKKQGADQFDEATRRLAGRREPEDIAKAIRIAANMVGLKTPRRGRPGRRPAKT